MFPRAFTPQFRCVSTAIVTEILALLVFFAPPACASRIRVTSKENVHDILQANLQKHMHGTGIIHGEAASFTEFPFAALLGYKCTESPDLCGKWDVDKEFEMFCSGSLIAPTVVLTAAHCLYELTHDGRKTAEAHYIYVLHGVEDPTNYTGSLPLVQAVDISKPPGAFENSWHEFDGDIALVRLKDPIEAKTVRLAVPGDGTSAPCRPAVNVGWGFSERIARHLWKDHHMVTNENARLQKIEGATVHTDEFCTKFSSHWREVEVDDRWQRSGGGVQPSLDGRVEKLKNLVLAPEMHLCTGGNQYGGACQGDSGGPVLVRQGAEFIQIGVTSHGAGCGIMPDFAIRVSFYSEWIAEQLSAWTNTQSIGMPATMVSATWAMLGDFGRLRAPVSGTEGNATLSWHCKEGEWQCPDDGKCIDAEAVCNGTRDCVAGGDEISSCGDDSLGDCAVLELGEFEDLVHCENELWAVDRARNAAIANPGFTPAHSPRIESRSNDGVIKDCSSLTVCLDKAARKRLGDVEFMKYMLSPCHKREFEKTKLTLMAFPKNGGGVKKSVKEILMEKRLGRPLATPSRAETDTKNGGDVLHASADKDLGPEAGTKQLLIQVLDAYVASGQAGNVKAWRDVCPESDPEKCWWLWDIEKKFDFRSGEDIEGIVKGCADDIALLQHTSQTQDVQEAMLCHDGVVISSQPGEQVLELFNNLTVAL